LENEWRALVAGARLALPFLTFEWNVAWWTAFAESRQVVKDELAVRTIRDEHGTLIGVAPLTLTTRPARGPVRTRMLQMFGADHNLTEIRGLVCSPEREADVVGALAQHLA